MTSFCKARWVSLVVAAALCATAAANGIAGEVAEAQTFPRPDAPATGVEAQKTCDFRSGELHAVLRITDANSIIIDDGSEVRLGGIMFPPVPLEAANPWAPAIAARAAFEKLTWAESITVSQTVRQPDRYGRTIADVHLAAQTGEWVQRRLVEQGHAIASSRSGVGAAACHRDLLAAEQVARSAKRGLWANAYYRIHAANRPADLLRLRSHFTLVEGRVVSVTPRAGRLYMSFGDSWKSDFTIVVPKPLLSADRSAAERLSAMAGKRVRVRGWLESRYGPSIEIHDLADIEDVEVPGVSSIP